MISAFSEARARTFLWLIFLATAAAGQSAMPTIEGESFANQKIILPDAAKGKLAVLVFGFTKASKTPAVAWANKVQSEFGTRSGFEFYELPVLEDVPRFVRGMVISSIKKGVPESMRAHFMPILQHEAELKKLVNYQEPDDAYLVVLDASGQIVAQRHGQFSDTAYTQFRNEIESLLVQQK